MSDTPIKIAGNATLSELTWATWGRKLFEHSFKSPAGERALSRLCSSRRVLEAISGLPAREAQRNFICSFGGDRRAILARYDYPVGIPSDSELQSPPTFFSSLYLSLLAAGADEDTNQVGDFRKRFCLMVNAAWDAEIFEVGQLTNAFGNLPSMWAYVKQWLDKAALNEEGWSQLHLPQVPTHERLIGASKRLAFPSYKDEVKIRQVLIQNNLDSGALPDRVEAVFSREIYNSHSGLTENCRDEFQNFSMLLHSTINQVEEAMKTPFWGAICDVDLGTNEDDSSAPTEYCFSVSVEDPSGFEVNLYAKTLGANESTFFSAGAYYKAKYRYQSMSTSIETLRDLIRKMLSSERRHPQLRKLRESFDVGFLTLYIDDEGQINTEAKFSGQAPEVYFLVNEELRAKLMATPIKNMKSRIIRELDPKSQWWLLHFFGLSSATRIELFRMLPSEVTTGIRFFGETQMLGLRGGVRLKGTSAFVVNRFTCERFYTSEVGDAQLNYLERNTRRDGGMLEVRGPGALGLPTVLKGQEKSDLQIEATVTLPTGRPLRKRLRCFSRSPYACIPKFLDGTAVTDGCNGQLDLELDIYNYIFETDTAQNKGGYSPSPILSSQLTDVDVVNVNADEAIEFLCARFESTRRVDQSELRLSFAEARHCGIQQVDQLVKHLHNSALIKRVTTFSENRYVYIAAEARYISMREEGPGYRYTISGLFNRYERDQLCAFLEGYSCRIEKPEEYCSDGSYPLKFFCSSALDIGELESKFSLRFIDAKNLNPFDGFSVQALSTSKLAGFRDSHAEYWNPKHFSWGELLDDTNAPTKLARIQSPHSALYYIIVGGVIYRTNSINWAFLWYCYFREGAVAEITNNSVIMWHGSVRYLPAPFMLWWIHFCGGYITTMSDGRLAMTGCEVPEKLGDFFISTGLFSKDHEIRNIALARWRGSMRRSYLHHVKDLIKSNET